MAGVRQFDEDALLEKALDLFWRQGFSATSMPDLAAATGVQRGSLYHAFGGKRALFLLAFERYACRFLEKAAAALALPEPAAALAAFLEVAVANMTGGLPARGCLTTRTAVESADVEREIADRLRRLLDDLACLLATALSREPARNLLALDATAAAELVVTFTRGLAVMERVYRDERRLKANAAALVALLFPPRSRAA